jgi:hypothetical protein
MPEEDHAMADEQPVPISVTLPRDLWRQANQTAVGERCEINDLIIEGLKMVLAVKGNRARFTPHTMAEKKDGGHLIQKSVQKK